MLRSLKEGKKLKVVVRDRAARVWGCNSSRVNDPRPGTQVRKHSKKGGPEVRLSWVSANF